MSSMLRITLAVLAASTALSASAPLVAENAMPDARAWDQARAELVASQPGAMAGAIARWERLSASQNYNFNDYSSFILSYPGFPQEERLRRYAESRLQEDYIESERLIAFFDRHPPLTNPARAQYAIALATQRRPEAAGVARAAWRGGTMSPTAEATLLTLFGSQFTQDDHDARMDALLWDRDTDEAARQINAASMTKRSVFMARLAAAQGERPEALGLPVPVRDAVKDPGYLYNIVREMRKGGRAGQAVDLLANRPKLESLPHDPAAWVEELLTVARLGNARQAQQIAASIDDAFVPGADISRMGYSLRDDYTSLMWLGGTSALWDLRDPHGAAPLFYRYGAAARTPQTRSKGFYWAGLASAQAGDSAGANRYFEMAAEYPSRFYGMLALERLGRPIPALGGAPTAQPDPAQRAEFNAKPLTKAVREVARDAPWSTGIRFYRAIAEQAETEAEMVLVAELARDIGRRDLAVILGEEAAEKGFDGFTAISFPTVPTPPATNWAMVHAISRQESQFAQNAISHAGARGLMQLMPGTAREQAGKSGLTYLSASLIDDAQYNMRLGDGYFSRMMSYYDGSYPLAVAAYNGGPGNVNKWIRANGDPRTGSISWVEWIERIPFYETKNYVQRVLENAAVYEAMHPEKAEYGRPKSISRLLGKSTPG